VSSRPASKWWGWGDPARRFEPSPGFLDFLGARREPGPAPAPPALPERRPVCAGLRQSTSDEERLAHAAGRSYLDLVRLRSGALDRAPDAVLYPESADAVADILRRADCAIVPFGGGTSVVGGVAPIAGEHPGVATLDMTRMARVLDVDRESRLARIEAGIFGPALEAELSKHGLTLGHFPQSFEFSTLGGWIAARSAGQNSTKYGRIEDRVAGLRVVTPAGEIATRVLPATASGPEIRELMVGSEGTLGVIVDATLRVHAIPQRRAFRSFLFRSFEAGVRAVRRLAQSDVFPAIVRLSDETETEVAMKLSGADRGFGYKVLRLLGRAEGAHLMVGFEGSTRAIERECDDAHEIARREEGFPLGAGPGEKWVKDRFSHPYLRDALLDRGMLVETLETATTWSNLLKLYGAVKAALSGRVVCHVSHVYPDGASLYFTVMADVARGEEEARWTAMKKAACDAIVGNDGTLSHHHGIGADHRPWMEREKGAVALDALRSLKRNLDPRGMLNPGKLL